MRLALPKFLVAFCWRSLCTSIPEACDGPSSSLPPSKADALRASPGPGYLFSYISGINLPPPSPPSQRFSFFFFPPRRRALEKFRASLLPFKTARTPACPPRGVDTFLVLPSPQSLYQRMIQTLSENRRNSSFSLRQYCDRVPPPDIRSSPVQGLVRLLSPLFKAGTQTSSFSFSE